MMKFRTSLPPLEHFSKNPRLIRDNNPVPILSLLGINNSSQPTFPNSSRIKQTAQLPPLQKNRSLNVLSDGSNSSRIFSAESNIKTLPGAPLTPAEVLQVFGDRLVPLELGEILKYKDIYYIGDIENKPIRASYDTDYNDRKKQYRAQPNDHINYRYQIINHAGGGAFSTVYRCYDHKLHIPVAVKIIRAKPDCLQYAELEAKIQSQLQGKHSVKLIESFHFRGHYCLSMELLYTDIYSIVEKKTYPQLPPDTVRHITFQTLLCLRELAAKGIVHADIKPENILTNDESLVYTKVADFGTACFAEEQIFSYIQSRYYRAPEVLYGIKYGPPIDMWSLGCVVYELIVGQPLFAAQDEEELAEMLNIAIGSPPRSIYENSTKWSMLPHVASYSHDYRPSSGSSNNANSALYHMQPLAFMVSVLPRVISKFIRRCLMWDPDQRLTPEQALQTEWMQQEIDVLIAKRKKRDGEIDKLHEPTSPKTSVRSLAKINKLDIKEQGTSKFGKRPHWHF